jgi:hypothetical protein
VKILYSSEDVRDTVIDLFSNSRKRRVAIVAFVGYGAEAYLPSPSGLELYCWPQPGSTDPDTLVDLIDRGAKVYFVDGLHMKVYYCEGTGAVITSANLSTNAFGAGNLLEAGILLSSEDLSIDELLQSFEARPASPEELLRLEKRHKDYKSRNPGQFVASTKSRSFDEWYTSKNPKPWKIAVINGTVRLASEARKIAINEYGRKNPHNWISTDLNDYNKHDWILTFRLNENSPKELEWFSVDYSVEVSHRKYDDNPCQYVQLWSLDRYTRPPFRLDKVFRKYLKESITDYGSSKLESKKNPPKKLIDLLFERFQKGKNQEILR